MNNAKKPFTAVDFFATLNMDPSARSRPPASVVRGTYVTGSKWFRSWHHLVLTKSGGTVALFLDGDLLVRSRVCTSSRPGVCDISFPPCSAIESTSYPSGLSCSNLIAAQIRLLEPIPFVIGAIQDRGNSKYASHRGYIASVRMLSIPLNEIEVMQLYKLNTALVQGGQMSATTYWVSSSGGLLTPSPSQRHCDVTMCPNISVMGRFQYINEYICRWTAGDVFTDWIGVVSNQEGTCGGQCENSYGNKLTCRAQNPVWSFGYKAATLTIGEREPGSASSWSLLWQRTCLDTTCGFISVNAILKVAARPWWLYWGHPGGTYYFGLNRGGFTLFTFQTASSIFSYTENGTVSKFSIPTALGASRSTFFESNGSFVAVANYWNGRSTRTLSTIVSLMGESATFIQSIPTFAATGWKFFDMNDKRYLAISNYESNSSIYR
jgi:hypothetical protein